MGTCSNITCYLNVYTNHDQHVVCQLAAFLNKIYNCVMQNSQLCCNYPAHQTKPFPFYEILNNICNKFEKLSFNNK